MCRTNFATLYDWVLNDIHFFFFNDTATTEIYTLSLHTLFRSMYVDTPGLHRGAKRAMNRSLNRARSEGTRLNSSHVENSYAVFCLKKKISRNVAFRHHVFYLSHFPRDIRHAVLRVLECHTDAA